jgi:AsmA-like protein
MNKRFWLRLLIAGMVIAFVASSAISGALEYGWARRPLLARLAKSFGRPVEVGHFAFSLLGGPTLEADSVIVDEDPRFGQEYFLRADQLTAGLRWTALVRGRVEFGSLLLTRPSLNLVHNPDGHWNIESWLPPGPRGGGGPIATSGGGASPAIRTVGDPVTERLRHIDVEGGRINFKLQADKLSFALTEVSGHLDQDSAGRWSLDLTAKPMRTSVALQDAGTLTLIGTVAGTAERLRPAALALTWSDASLADGLRLAGGRDFGVRGTFAADLTARIADAPPSGSGQNAAAQWTFGGNVRFAGIHRWDLAGRTVNPGVSFSFDAAWRPGERQLQISRWIVASPHSRVEAVGAVNWSNGFHPRAQIASSHISFDDLLAWARAFAPSIADDLAIDGTVGVDATVADWPPRIERLELASEGAALRTPGSPAPLHVGRMIASLQRNTLVLAPVSITLPGLPDVASAAFRTANPLRNGARNGAGNRAPNQATARAELPVTRVAAASAAPPAGNFLVEASVGPFRTNMKPRDWGYRIAVAGETQRTEDLAAVAVAFARPPDSGSSANAGNNSADLTALPATDWTAEWLNELIKNWRVSGPAALHLVWAGSLHRATTAVSGALELRSLRMSSALMNHPVVVSATVDLRPGERRVSIASADAFGAHWKGSLHKSAGDEWIFDLSADHLDAAELDRWLGPRARKGLFARMLPFAVAPDPESPSDAAMDSTIASLRARGRLRVAEVTLDPVRLERLDSTVELRGRNLALRDAQAVFYGGRLTGDFEARLSPAPAYSIRARIDRANLTDLAAATVSLAGRFAGLASGDLRLAAHGVGRDDLLKSLQGDGTLRVRDPLLNGLLPASLPSGLDGSRTAARAGEAPASVEDRFGLATASFHVAGEHIVVDELSLAGREAQIEARGTVDFAKRLDFRVASTPYAAIPVSDSQDAAAPPGPWGHDEWVGSGTLDAPRWIRSGSFAGNGAVAARAHR